MASPKPLTLDALDGIRGLSALVIVVGHLLTFWVPHSSAPPANFIAFGLEYLSPVTFFVVASGFTLVVVYDKMKPSSIGAASNPAQNGVKDAADSAPAQLGAAAVSVTVTVAPPFATWAEIFTFLRNRVARLAAMYYLGLAIGLVPFIAYADVPTIITSTITTLLAVQSIVVTGIAWDGPVWTVSAFVLCYLCFVPLMRCMRRMSVCCLIGTIVSICISLISIAAPLILAGAGSTIHVVGPLRVPQFVVGMAFGYMSKRIALVSATVAAEVCSAIVLLNIALCAIVTWLVGNQFPWYITYAYGAEWMLTPVHGVWMWALSSADCGGVSRPVLSSRPLTFLGDISYALYCLHWPVLNWCAWAVAARGVSAFAVPQSTAVDGPTGWFAFPAWAIIPLLIVCVIIATAAHFAIEEPFRKWLSGKATHGRRAAATEGAAKDGVDNSSKGSQPLTSAA